MASEKRSKERESFLIVVGILLILSLVASVVLFYFLDSYAQVQNKVMSLGGAVAGFFVIFILLRNTYFRITSVETKFEKSSADEKINKLEEQIEGLIASKLDNFIVPHGYKSEISKEFKFGFCYPKGWEFSKFPKQTFYGFALDSKSTEEFKKNVNVIIEDISTKKGELSEIYQNTMKNNLAIMPNSELIFKEESLFQGLPALKYRINYTTNLGERLTLYQILVADKDRKNAFIITFTTTQEEFESSRILLDSIASTFRI